MARPTKLDDDLQARIVAVLRAGGTIASAAVTTGAGERSVYRWLDRGRRDGPQNARHVKFARAVEQARAEGEAQRIATLIAATRMDWRAAAWFLEREYPERWGT
jgi:transposase